MPLFLFSGMFFPVTPAARRVLEWVAYVTPLWHGVALCRGLALGTLRRAAEALLHVAYLLLWVVAGVVAGGPRLPASGWSRDRRRGSARAAAARCGSCRCTRCRCGRAGMLVEAQPAGLPAQLADLIVSGFFEPLFYLLSIGVGIGALVGSVVTDSGADGRATQQFVAPGAAGRRRR